LNFETWHLIYYPFGIQKSREILKAGKIRKVDKGKK